MVPGSIERARTWVTDTSFNFTAWLGRRRDEGRIEVPKEQEGGLKVCIPSQSDKRREEREGMSKNWRNIDSSLLSIWLFIACSGDIYEVPLA